MYYESDYSYGITSLNSEGNVFYQNQESVEKDTKTIRLKLYNAIVTNIYESMWR